ncbi:MAG: glycoside hydrolase family 15 protein [Myxococcales bacterium]|nr:glycoside hydrolase family 15 protein [Myxococcales bacterium]
MDLVSLSARLSRPFVLGRSRVPELPLDARGLIGDGVAAALVAVDGAIDWLCVPRFDGPSVFARVLDAERGGSMAIRPCAQAFESLQAYDPDTNVLETLMTTPRGERVRLIDFMPFSDDPRAALGELHRRIDCPSGEIELEIVFDPRFDYGREIPIVHAAEHGLLARGSGGVPLTLSVSRRLEFVALPGGGMRATTTLREGEILWVVLAWGRDEVEPTAAHRPFEQLRLTRRTWREWASRLAYDGPWRHHVLRAALVMKLLVYAPTGAVIAAPTASFPEWPGGKRNWDYRYTWARDAAMTVRATNLLGYHAEARAFFHFVRDAVSLERGLELMYSVDGGPVPAELELGHLCGALGARPVRIGNGAKDQTQLDTYGAVVDAAHLYAKFGGTLTLDAFRKIEGILGASLARWSEPDHGIWEPRDGGRHNVHSKVMNWVAMDRGEKLALAFGEHVLAQRLAHEAEQVRADVCARGMDPTGTHFVRAYGEPVADAALLLLPIHGFLPDDDPRLARTVDWVRTELGTGPFVHRYAVDDGVGGQEGAFTLCGFWLAEALAIQGRVEEAMHVFAAHAEASNHLGLLSEEIDPTTRAQLGNFPQAFSHLGLVNAAWRIDLAMRLRDEGAPFGPRLVGPMLRRP